MRIRWFFADKPLEKVNHATRVECEKFNGDLPFGTCFQTEGPENRPRHTRTDGQTPKRGKKARKRREMRVLLPASGSGAACSWSAGPGDTPAWPGPHSVLRGTEPAGNEKTTPRWSLANNSPQKRNSNTLSDGRLMSIKVKWHRKRAGDYRLLVKKPPLNLFARKSSLESLRNPPKSDKWQERSWTRAALVFATQRNGPEWIQTSGRAWAGGFHNSSTGFNGL